MSETILKGQEEDVMSLLSVTDEYDITHEEENTLLEAEEDMNVDNNNTTETSVRQKIVFDLNETNDSNCSDTDVRSHRFTSERQTSDRHTICLSLNESKRTQIPDSLDSVLIKDSMKQSFNKRRNRRRRRNRWHSSPPQTDRFNRFNDLREVLESNNNNNRSDLSYAQNQSLSDRLSVNLFNNSIPNQSVDLSSLKTLLNLQLLMNANQNLIQNSLLSLSNNQRINLKNIYGETQTPSLLQNKILNSNKRKDKEKIEITIINKPQQSSSKTSINTLPKFRCVVNNDDSESDSSQEIKELVRIESKSVPKLELKTKFGKHLVNKSNELKAETAQSSNSFTEALAEVEVGVDNEYLMKMEEIKRKRLELQKLKEERRYEMADQRLQNVNDLKHKLKMTNKIYAARQRTPY